MSKRLLYLFVAISVVFMFLITFDAFSEPQKDKIRIGWVTSLSGHNASGVAGTNGPVYDYWIDEINAKGGIYVKEYGKRLPVEVIKYDDKSDVGTMTKLLEKVILEDKVDFILPPWGTAMLYAAAPIANKHKYILLGGPGGAVKLKEIMDKLPYFFSVLNTAETQIPTLSNIFTELKVKKVAIIYIQDLHGIEYRDLALPEFKKKGIEVVFAKSFPFGTKDLTPMLKDAKAANVDAFLGFLYPDEAFLVTGQAMEVGFSPKVFFLTVGPCMSPYRDVFGAKGIEGVMASGAWNAKVSPGAKKLENGLLKRKAIIDYWGQLFYYSSLQFFEKAIEEAGTLNQAKIRELMSTKTYNTAMGKMRFEKGFNTTHPGEIAQWQKGVFEVIDPGSKRTAKPIYPKPMWAPKPPEKK
ncbi:MAG: amino acid ABC transporter substrate-binding protein [Spirochaetes bacterium]|nr:amino acid ABC transporter substrate-binding protein [Spirochaetota bacterium]